MFYEAVFNSYVILFLFIYSESESFNATVYKVKDKSCGCLKVTTIQYVSLPQTVARKSVALNCVECICGVQFSFTRTWTPTPSLFQFHNVSVHKVTYHKYVI